MVAFDRSQTNYCHRWSSFSSRTRSNKVCSRNDWFLSVQWCFQACSRTRSRRFRRCHRCCRIPIWFVHSFHFFLETVELRANWFSIIFNSVTKILIQPNQFLTRLCELPVSRLTLPRLSMKRSEVLENWVESPWLPIILRTFYRHSSSYSGYVRTCSIDVICNRYANGFLLGAVMEKGIMLKGESSEMILSSRFDCTLTICSPGISKDVDNVLLRSTCLRSWAWCVAISLSFRLDLLLEIRICIDVIFLPLFFLSYLCYIDCWWHFWSWCYPYSSIHVRSFRIFARLRCVPSRWTDVVVSSFPFSISLEDLPQVYAAFEEKRDGMMKVFIEVSD